MSFLHNLRNFLTAILCLLSVFRLSATQTGPDCPSGSEWTPSAQACEDCAIGYYRSRGVDDVCQQCEEGYVTRTTGAKRESDCVVPIGSRVKCESGTEWISKIEECLPCKVGTYRQKGVEYWCMDCPDGLTTPTEGAVTQGECVGKCGPGTVWHGGMSSCLACPVNTYRGHRDLECQTCPDGHVTSYPGSTSQSECFGPPSLEDIFIDECPPGTQWQDGVRGCEPCARGWYRQEDMSECTSCPSSHSTVLRGGLGPEFCIPEDEVRQILPPIQQPIKPVQCPLGSEPSANGCRPCPVGTYRDSMHQGMCQWCPSQQDTPTTGTINPQLCGSDQPGDTTDVFKQDECPLGSQWQTSLNQCILCSHGTYRSTTDICQACPNDQTTARRGATSKAECLLPAIHGKEKPVFEPSDCPAGTEWWSKETVCRPCPRGFYRPEGSTTTTCSQCPVRSTTVKEGSKLRLLCVQPLEGPETLPLGLGGCAAGYQLSRDRSQCQRCPKNTYKSTAGDNSCGYCPFKEDGSGFRETQFEGATDVSQCLKDVRISRISPIVGPQSGSTVLTLELSSSESETLRVIAVRAAGQDCQLSHFRPVNNTITCHTNPSRTLTSGSVEVTLGDGRVLTSPQSFTYGHDPTIDSIDRLKAFASGGVNITVIGASFDVIMTQPVMTLTPRDAVWSQATRVNCQQMDTSLMMCTLPNLTAWFDNNSRRRRRRDVDPTEQVGAGVGFDLDGLPTYTDLSMVMPHSDTLVVYKDPVIEDFENGQFVLEATSQISLKGRRLDSGCLISDYAITVGGNDCQIVNLSSVVVTCQVTSEDNLDVEVPYVLQVVIGPLIFNPGSLLFVKPVVTTTTTARPTTTTLSSKNAATSTASLDTATATMTTDTNTSRPAEHTDDDDDSGETGNAEVTSVGMTVDGVTPPIGGSVSDDDDDDDDLLKILLPLFAVLILLLLIIILVAVCLRRRRRRRPKDGEEDLTKVSSLSSSPDSSVHSDPHLGLPPLPVESVFGHNRVTDKGTNMKPLALPRDGLSHTMLNQSERLRVGSLSAVQHGAGASNVPSHSPQRNADAPSHGVHRNSDVPSHRGQRTYDVSPHSVHTNSDVPSYNGYYDVPSHGVHRVSDVPSHGVHRVPDVPSHGVHRSPESDIPVTVIMDEELPEVSIAQASNDVITVGHDYEEGIYRF